MLVVHLSCTPLAGAPIRLCKAINDFTDFDARLINLNPNAYGSRVFDEDLVFSDSPSDCRRMILDADLVHLHHYLDVRSNPFGVDLSDKVVLRHFHSEPGFVARSSGVSVEEVLSDGLPKVCIAQYHERMYPNARVVPNILNFDDIEVARRSLSREGGQPVVSFSPTTATSIWEDRWNTKGSPEVLREVARLKREEALPEFVFDFFQGVPYHNALLRRAYSDIVIDDLVTGSYHLTSLEAMALGRACLCFLDQRCVAVVAAMTGSSSLPWLNVHLNELSEILPFLLRNRDVVDSIGEQSRDWIYSYWRPEILVRKFVEIYQELLSGNFKCRESDFCPLRDRGIPDVNWMSMRERLQPPAY